MTPCCVLRAVWLVWLSLGSHQRKVEAFVCASLVCDPVLMRLQHLAVVVCTDGIYGPFNTLHTGCGNIAAYVGASKLKQTLCVYSKLAHVLSVYR